MLALRRHGGTSSAAGVFTVGEGEGECRRGGLGECTGDCTEGGNGDATWDATSIDTPLSGPLYCNEGDSTRLRAGVSEDMACAAAAKAMVPWTTAGSAEPLRTDACAGIPRDAGGMGE